MSRILLSALLVTACNSTGETATDPGQVELCIGGDHGEGVVEDRYQRWSIEGTIVEATPSFDQGSCARGDAPSRTLSIQDADDNIVHIGWTATAEEGASDFTPSLDVATGDLIEIDFTAIADWGSDHTLVVRDADGLIFAAEEGYAARISEVDPSLLGSLTVTRGNPIRSIPANSCGKREVESMEFETTELLSLGVWVEGTIDVDGTAMQARNVGAWSFDGTIGCTDTWGPAPWIVFR